jgi:hypothetical protein
MNGSGKQKESIGADIVEGVGEGVMEIWDSGVLDAVGDVVGEIAGAVIGGIFDGI